MPQDPDELRAVEMPTYPAFGHGKVVELPPPVQMIGHSPTDLRISALDFAMRYPPADANMDAGQVVSDAEMYLAFLQGNSESC
jgi:hypothetical protein